MKSAFPDGWFGAGLKNRRRRGKAAQPCSEGRATCKESEPPNVGCCELAGGWMHALRRVWATAPVLWGVGSVLIGAMLAMAADANEQPAKTTSAGIEPCIAKGIQFLVECQNADGSWGSPRRTKDLNIYAPVPGAHHAFRNAVTALCVEALIATRAGGTNPAAVPALERGETWLLEHLPKLRRADGVAIYNIWGHAYGIQALAAMHRRAAGDGPRQERIREVIRSQIALLQRYESVDGGWGYYDFQVQSQRPASWTLSFVSATVLLAFHEAKALGVEPPGAVVQRALASIQRQRKPDHSYLYGEYLKWRPMREINRTAGSLGRSHACNLALRQWGDATITDEVITGCLDRLVARNDWLSFGRKRPIPHESWFQVAGYFFYYGHYYAAICLETLPAAVAARYGEALARVLVPLQETDGSWWDFPLYDYHQPYGTAFALMSLQRCREAQRSRTPTND